MSDKNSVNVQQRFTAYLLKTIENTRMNYLKKKARIQSKEQLSALMDIQGEVIEFESQYEEYQKEQYDSLYASIETEQLISMFIDDKAISAALLKLNQVELKVVFARIFAQQSFREISLNMNVKLQKASSIYYYAIKKMSKELRSRNEL